jgi:hypothetical protein
MEHRFNIAVGLRAPPRLLILDGVEISMPPRADDRCGPADPQRDLAAIEVLGGGGILSPEGPQWYHGSPEGHFVNSLHLWKLHGQGPLGS